MSEPCIQVNDLRVIYNKGKSNEVRSLDCVSVDIFPEEYIIIFGPSGCGKSTLLYGISGLQAPTYGDVTVHGKNLAKMSKRERADFHQSGIGMVFQAFYLIDTLTVLDNVCLPKVFRGDDLEEGKEAAMKLLRRFGIAEQADKFPSQLSGGQKQRVSIARALINDPGIILADEPVGNLDSESAQNVLDIFREINRVDKKTLVMVTHNPEHLPYADRVIRMKDGKKVAEEVNNEKRPIAEVQKEMAHVPEAVSNELELLLRSFSGLSPLRAGMLITPFKVKQLLNYALSDLTEEQVNGAENFLKDLFFKEIDVQTFASRLDLDPKKGGAGWNKARAEAFAKKVGNMLEKVDLVVGGKEGFVAVFCDRLIKEHDLRLDQESVQKMRGFVELRINSKIDKAELQRCLDVPKRLGGIGLYKNTAEKLAREVELMMLIKYSS